MQNVIQKSYDMPSFLQGMNHFHQIFLVLIQELLGIATFNLPLSPFHIEDCSISTWKINALCLNEKQKALYSFVNLGTNLERYIPL